MKPNSRLSQRIRNLFTTSLRFRFFIYARFTSATSAINTAATDNYYERQTDGTGGKYRGENVRTSETEASTARTLRCAGAGRHI